MSSKADYLKKYLSRGSKSGAKKKKKSVKRAANLAIHDDDIDWRSVAPVNEEVEIDEDDPDAAPVVASVKDESVQKWLPVAEMDVKNQKRSVQSTGTDFADNSPLQSDLDPVRRRRYGDSSSAQLMTEDRHRVSKSSESSDLSPVRYADEQDLSPPRVQQNILIRRPNSPDVITRANFNDEFQRFNDSPPLKRSRHDSMSPPRETRVRHDSPDLNQSPHRTHEHIDLKEVTSKRSKDKLLSRPDSESQHLPKNKKSPRNLEQSIVKDTDHGRYAETVYRDKYGKKVDLKLEKIRKREEERMKAETDEKFMEWGRGVAQTQSSYEKIADDVYEMSKPLARYADDEDLEKMLKEREREGDPMLAFIKKKAETTQKRSGKAKKMKPTYQGTFPANRFGIRPGFRWDGVNRSNGFEKAWFRQQSNQKAVADEAYKWSVEDM